MEKLELKYPNHIPVIFLPYQEKYKPMIRKKYLVSNRTQLYTLTNILKHEFSLSSKENICIFIGESKTIYTPSTHIADIYSTCKNKSDGFLYIYYSIENTYG